MPIRGPIYDADFAKGLDALRTFATFAAMQTIFWANAGERQLQGEGLAHANDVRLREVAEGSLQRQLRRQALGEHILDMPKKLRRAVGEGISAQGRGVDRRDAAQDAKPGRIGEQNNV